MPFFQELFIISHNAVEALILPQRTAHSPDFVDLMDSKAFYAMDNLRKIKKAALGSGERLHQEMNMIWHDHCGIDDPFASIPIFQGLQSDVSFFRCQNLIFTATPGNEIHTLGFCQWGKFLRVTLKECTGGTPVPLWLFFCMWVNCFIHYFFKILRQKPNKFP